MSVSIKSFKVSRLCETGFNIKKANKTNPFNVGRYNVNWNTSDSQKLTLRLNEQIYNEFYDMGVIGTLCEAEEEEEMFVVGLENGEPTYYKNYNITGQQKKEGSKKFLSYARDYEEVMSRDQDAFEQKNFNVDIYAVVLIVDNTYHGHIYAWISPNDKKYCFAMGIRNRVDTIFTKYNGNNVKNVSGFLLDGVRQYGINMGAEYIIVVYPKPIMEKILPTMGFEKTTVKGVTIGTCISPFSFVCNNCYKLKNILTPIISDKVEFDLI